ncbi:putative inactive leucine-rich repeat receptor-like protein kinase At3g03770 isoform X2 [Castanea sativa]|uniref:putative inactive leucine-rich repeat receptor-like protein kinase At3g03770 isoform X2 n=1 Tax=Castanea sativa TaxID=21020 RepID=UPI003F649287
MGFLKNPCRLFIQPPTKFTVLMAKTALHSFHLLLLMLFLAIHHSDQWLQPSQTQALLKNLQLLNYQPALSSFHDTTDFCSIEPTPSFTVACYESNITQLHIIGNNGFPPLSENFSADTFFATLKSLSSLKVLSLASLGLWGSLPGSIGDLSSLEIVNVSSNYFSGDIPVQLSSLKNLQTIILDNNKFTGQVPGWLSSLPVLSVLSLKNNMLSGSLPTSLTTLQALRVLAISNNNLTGEVPDLSNLTNLQVLDLEDNSLGLHFPTLPTKLVSLVLRNNSRVVLYGRNCLSNEAQDQHRSSFCYNEALAVKVPHEQKNKKPYAKAVLASTAGGIMGGIAIVGVVFLAVRKVHSKATFQALSSRSITERVSPINTAKLLSDARYISLTMKLGASLPAYRSYALEELKEATNNFDASSLLGEGSHGQVYKGKLSDGTFIAIRCLKMRKRYSPQTYTHHIEMISKLRHCHLVSSLGHCFECYQDDSSMSRIFLIFEFVPNGTLRGYISGLPKQRFTWTQRIAAAIGVVKGIQFLHTGIVPGVYSNNLKITDVLLDNNLQVKISSYYKLPLLAENRGTMGAVLSSPGSRVSSQARVKREDENDVYDIGVILLEIILGRSIMFYNEVSVLKDLLQVSITTDDIARRSIVDHTVHKECSDKSLKTVMEICVRCLSSEPSDRPTVEDVLWTLQFAAQVQDSWREDTPNHVD